MKFLANFDTNLEYEIVSKYNKLYGKENVLCIHRAKIFWLIHCVLPTIWIVAFIAFFLVIWNISTWDTSLDFLKSIIAFIMIVGVLFTWGRKVLKRYFDYKMDFCIVTPQEVVNYNQTWFLWRTSRTIDADKIKTVSANPNWFIKAIFNFGDLTFLSEWDQSGWWDISLNFVHDVNITKNKVRELIEPHLQRHNKHENKSTS